MDIEKVLSITLFSAYGIIFLIGGVGISFVTLEKRKARRSLRESISKKMTGGIQLSAADIITMAKGVGLQRPSVNRIVYKLLHDTYDPQLFQQLKALSGQLEKEEPFDDLPEEVKPSLIRLTELCDGSQQKSDQFLLTPIQKTLGSYVELKAEAEKTKKQTKWVNTIGIVSFIIGTWGFYLTWKSPDAKDIEAAVARALNTQANGSNSSLQLDALQAASR
ncbi:hypothetical protein [Delftia acidovorans]